MPISEENPEQAIYLLSDESILFASYYRNFAIDNMSRNPSGVRVSRE